MKVVFANNVNDLYLMSAILSHSVIYSSLKDDASLVFKAAILIDGIRYMGSIIIEDIIGSIDVSLKRLQFLSSITLNHRREIEFTTSHEVMCFPVNNINLSFLYDEESFA